jgi:hypothetical protein
VTSAIRHCDLPLICSHKQFWFVSVVLEYFKFAYFQKVGLLSICYNCVSHFLTATQTFTSFSQHALSDPPHYYGVFSSPDTTPYLSTSQNAFHAQTFHAALLCVVTRSCSWPTARSIKMEVSCDMTSYFSRRYRRFGITNWLRGSLSYSEDLSRTFPQMLLLTYQNARCHSFDPPRKAPDLDPSPNTKTVNALCLSNHNSLCGQTAGFSNV